MSRALPRSAKCFVGMVNKKPAAFVSANRFPHPKVKNFIVISRVVTLPDYQGIGVGGLLRDAVSDWYCSKYQRVIMTTSHMAFVKSMQKNSKWICKRNGRVGSAGRGSKLKSTMSRSRITSSWEYQNERQPTKDSRVHTN